MEFINNNNGEFLYSSHTVLCAIHTYYPWSLDLFIHVIFQLPVLECTTIPAISVLGTNHMVISVPGNHLHLSQVKHVRVKCLVQRHNIEIMSQYKEGRNMIFL